MCEQQRIVTIDGPSGGGKSTVSRILAARLGFTYLDTGAMYRAVAYTCRQRAIDPGDAGKLEQILADIRIELLPPGEGGDDVRVIVDGVEVGGELRSPEMGMLASAVSAQPPVRSRLTLMQQRMGEAKRHQGLVLGFQINEAEEVAGFDDDQGGRQSGQKQNQNQNLIIKNNINARRRIKNNN